MMTVFEELKRRGLIAQMTHEEQIEEKLTNEKCTFYIGFDATADSLHVGHFLQLVVMKHLQKAGHKPIVLLGTGTTLVGDPTGRTDMRKMLKKDDIDHNAECFKEQMSHFIDFSSDKALIIKNGDWLLNLNYIDFLRNVGRYFSVNKMLTAECVKSRLEHGLSFLEFNYMLMQSYDFLKLYEDYDCTLQLGGDDQWSNILGGIDLIRRVKQKQAYGMTFCLLTTKEGKKMGKTQSGALWLDANKCSPYEFFQYWRNIDDADVIKCLKLLTFLPIEQIENMENWEGAKLNEAKELLAFEVTKMVHGEKASEQALKTSKNLFSKGNINENMPTTELSNINFKDNEIGILNLLVTCGLCKSNG
ncbi:MAG: tyrosine--tRNA ligase, partial [Oscillospiraceae bacterium]|nr:tyrosine--tRNA ligase [Oscillospiraceae bacterium]